MSGYDPLGSQDPRLVDFDAADVVCSVNANVKVATIWKPCDVIHQYYFDVTKIHIDPKMQNKLQLHI